MALEYTTAAAIKTAADISDTNDDDRIGACATAVNELIESYIGAPVGDGGTATRTFDASASKTLWLPHGVRAITTLEYASDSAAAKAGTYTEIAATEYVLRGVKGESSDHVPTDWPLFQLILIDGSSPSTFTAGYDTVRITPSGGWGWASIPADLARVALIAALRVFQSSQSGDSLAIGTTDFGAAIVRFLPEPEYQNVLERYRGVLAPSWVL